MNLFPMIQPELQEVKDERKLYREVKWNYEKNIPEFVNGSPVIVSGKEAVLVWAWKALHTSRYRYEIYSWDYGNETETLIGKPFSDELKQAEAERYIRECLLINPYITEVETIKVEFDGNRIKLECIIHTVYGEVTINV